MREYLYKLLARYLGLYVRPQDSLVAVEPSASPLSRHMPNVVTLAPSEIESSERLGDTDYVLLNGVLHYERDIQGFLEKLHGRMGSDSRLIVTYYSSLWKPLMRFASASGIRSKSLEPNWLAHEDIANLLHLADFEPIRVDNRVLIPFRVPLLSALVNRYLAPLPFFRLFSMVNILIARPRFDAAPAVAPSVSVVVPARNEAGNIEEIVRRVPRMGPDDELIFIEGGSTDDTWARIQGMQRDHGGDGRIVIGKQDGKGKGDAVRKGFNLASKEILMILDADLTVPPEDLPKFYEAIASGKGEFINGSRLIYPMEKRAMRFLNLLGNKFFAVAFSFVVGQRFKDTLCGTKVISRANYERLAAHRSYFGEFDPFGDFDLIFGAARMGLRIVEVPITYRERTYGATNISRWRHGAILLAMLGFSARKLKFL
jgi:hypothetical protein